MAALRRRGLRVSPYKVGPDYIDPSYHRAASGAPATALDTWMLGREGAIASFARTATGDVAVIEGVMGLYDGASPETETGSTAEVAKLLGCPVILVIDGSAVARSAAATALGFKAFDPDVRIAGVVANRIAGEGHAAYLRPSIEQVAGLPLLGWLPGSENNRIPERHLGLVMAGEMDGQALIDGLANLIEEHLDVDRLLSVARSADPISIGDPELTATSAKCVRIAVARDEAFCFYYPDNFALLEQAGADLVYFSPLRDHSLPPDVDALYIGGGYPELHARSLSANGDMIASIVEFERTGKSIFAECGGFMYLCESLVDVAGDEHSMAGLLGGRTVMEKRLQAIGYREAVVETDSFLGPAGTVIRGHEFRHSRYEGDAGSPAFMVGDKPFGHRRGNIIGSYVHLHFGSNPAAARHWVEACARSMGVTEARS